jgi:hypothetical protein
MPHYGCLRRVVKRGPPYDFSVDRRCVWKFCLFEQFSDNNIKLSVKDRNAKKVSFSVRRGATEAVPVRHYLFDPELLRLLLALLSFGVI